MLRAEVVGMILAALVYGCHGQFEGSSRQPNLVIPVSRNCTDGSGSEVATPLPMGSAEATEGGGGSGESASSFYGGRETGGSLYRGPCVELTEALNLLTSEVTLELEPGVHHLRPSPSEPSLLPPPHGLRHVALAGKTGKTGQMSVVIECNNEMGLAFVNISGLAISDVSLVNCEIGRDVLISSLRLLEESVKLWYAVPEGSKVGVFLGNCRDVVLRNVGVDGTNGLGLLGVNLLGESRLQNTTFSRNTRQSCNTTQPPRYEDAHREVGGGAVLVYQDKHPPTNKRGVSTVELDTWTEQHPHTLTVTDSTFERNAGCSSTAFSKEESPSTLDTHYLVGGGGGLSILLTQQSYSVNVSVELSTFLHNDAKEGAGAYVSTFSGVRRSSVSFVNCTFEQNGLRSARGEGSGIADSACHSGAGLMIRTDMKRPSDSDYQLSSSQTTTLIQIIGTSFSNNAALIKGGGVTADSAYTSMTTPTATPTDEGGGSEDIYSYSTQWIVQDSTFTGNTANQGSAAHFQQGYLLLSSPSSNEGARGRVPLTLRNVTSTRNTKHAPPGRKGTQLSSSALDIANLVVTIQDSLLCVDNAVTALVLRSSAMNVADGCKVHFLRNVGYRGGAVLLEGETSIIRLRNQSSVVFENNSAVLTGGAIHIIPPLSSHSHQEHLTFYGSCFLYPPTTRQNCSTCFNISRSLSSVRFANNHAPKGGAVFGSTLESCPWVWLMRFKTNENIYQAMYNDADSFIEFDAFPNSTSVLSTLPVKMEVNKEDKSMELYPGQIVNLRIMIMDNFGQTIPSVIQSTTFDASPSVISATIGPEGSWYVNYRRDPFLRVRGRENQSVNVTVIEILSLISVNLTVKLLPCSIGFVYNDTRGRCMCNPRLLERRIRCNFKNYRELTIPPNTWTGLLYSGPEDPANRTSLPASAMGDLVVNECPLSYCLGVASNTTPPNNDSQCLAGSLHGGVLCGGCIANHSAVLGPYNQCKVCTNISLMLIPLFAVAGIVLFLCIALFQLTVDKGWVYVIIFHCNTVTLYAYLLPSSSKLHHLLIPANLVSLQIGFGVCFYDGMTTLDHTGLQLVFPFYLFFLMVLFGLLSKRSSRLSQHFSPTQTFITLSIMSYTSVLETCVTAINAITLTTLNGHTSLRWTADPNLPYFTGKHRYLLIASGILVVVYIIPFPILMLLPGVVYKHTKNFKPFFDAMWAPYQIRFRFWLGARVLCLVAVYSMVYFLSTSGTRVLLFSTTLFLFLQVQASIRPFRSKWINLLDQTLIAIVVLLAALTPYSENSYASEYVREKIETEYRSLLSPRAWEGIVSAVLGVSYLLLIVGLCCNLAIRFPKVRGVHVGVKSAVLGCCGRLREEIGRRGRGRRMEESFDVSLPGLHDPDMGLRMTATSFRLSPDGRVPRRSFNRLRETLLDNEVQL